MKTNTVADACQIHIATVTPCFLPTSRRCNSQYHSINQIGIKILLLGQQSRVYIDSASDINLSFPALSCYFRPMLHRLTILSPSSPYLPVLPFLTLLRFFCVITHFTSLDHFIAVFLNFFFLTAIRSVFA